jgi:hypothetical protein
MANRQAQSFGRLPIGDEPRIQRSQNPGPWGASFPLMVIVISMGASHFH